MSIELREAWLNAMADRMAPRFEALGFPLPPFRVSIGFTSGGQRSKANAEVWSDAACEDGRFHIFICPDYDEPVMVASLLAHELAHAAVGLDQGHGGNFARVALTIGLKRPLTATTPGPKFEEWVAPFVEELGTFPHKRLEFSRGMRMQRRKRAAAGMAETEIEEVESEPVTSAPPKQGTRLLKAWCEECGYTVRVTKKWLEVGAPHCPKHGAMTPEVYPGGPDECPK